MSKAKWFTALSMALALGLAIAAPASATGTAPPAGATRDLYLVSTDGYVFLPGNGDDTCGLDPTRIDNTQFALNEVNGYCKTWIRGFAAANGPVRDPNENLGGMWNPPALAAKGKATLPAPILDVTQGDQVFLHLANIGNATLTAPNDPHTIHLHGQAVTTQNDGFPESSWVVPVGSQAVYYFYAENPGSYMYHCHVEASEHVQMGMYGAFIIRPKGFNAARPTVFQAPAGAFGSALTACLFNDDYNASGGMPAETIMLLSDVDTTWHRQVEFSVNPANAAAQFKANYWLLNGRSFPDTLRPALVTHSGENVNYALPGFSAQAAGPSGPPDGWLPGANHFVDYHTIIDINGFAKATARLAPPPRVLVRLIDMSFTSGPMHFHGWHFVKVGEDAQPVPKQAQKEEFTVASNSGKTYELIITAFPRNAANLPGSLYGNQSPPAPGVAQAPAITPNTVNSSLFTNGVLPPYSGTAQPLTLAGGSAPVFNADSDATLNAGGEPPAAFVAGLSVPGEVNATSAPFIRTKLPEQILTIAPILYGPGTLGGGTITGTGTQADPVVVSSLTALNPFPVPNNITDLWYPTHDHHDYKVTNNGLYPGGVVALIHAH